jgi:predicted AAA+ superfamily ATPase
MFYRRQILTKLERELDTKQIIVLTGMRQVGKTTLLKHLFEQIDTENKAFFDLGNPLHRKIFEEENYDSVWNNLKAFGVTNSSKAYLFLDEVQNLPEISQVVKYFYDHWKVKFFLTGSSSYYLKNLFPESLAGRKIIFELYPLTFSEFLSFNNVKKEKVSSKIAHELYLPYYKEYMEYGGFPSVVLEKDLQRKKVLLNEIFTSYFEQDAKSLADFKDISKLRDLILLLAPRIGSRIEIAKLASSLNLSRETVYSYLSFLEQTYFITLLPKYTKSIDRQAAGSKKLFLCDCGLSNILGNTSEGQVFEQSVYQNLRPFHKIAYYSRGGNNEIDIVVDEKIGYEVKMNGSKRDFANLVKRSKVAKVSESFLITLEYGDEEWIVPAVDLR